MSQTSLRIIFAGTPDFAAFHLQQLLASKHQVIAVYTQPDRPAGRGKKLLPSPVKKLALEHQLPVFQPTRLKDPAAQQTLKDLDADVMVVVAYGLILPQAILDAPRLGCINVHASLLPRWRGAAPIQRALAAGDRQTGVTIMQMDAGLDTGDMLGKVICDIADTDTGGTLHDKLAEAGAPALLATLNDLAAGRTKPQRQNDQEACYADKISKEELLIDWTQPARALALRIRAFNPFPVVYTLLDGQRIKIWQAQTATVPSGAPGAILRADKEGILVGCGEGALNLTQIQLPGGKPMDIAAVLNGHAALFSGDKQFQSNS